MTTKTSSLSLALLLASILFGASAALLPMVALAETGEQSTLNTAVADLVKNFWTGTASDGYITPTWDGIVGHDLPDSRGALWTASTMFNVLYGQYKANSTLETAQRISAQWHYIKSSFSQNDLTTCGSNSVQNWGVDDTGWNASMLLQIYDVTRDESQESPDESVVRDSVGAVLNSVMECLNERELRILNLYYGLKGYNSMTLEEIGEELGVTRERVRQLRDHALDKLRHPARIGLLREIREN